MSSSLPPTPNPTRVRYSMLGLLCLLAMITYLDRAMYGSAKGDMMAAVGRPVTDFFWVLTAFQLAYALFEVPTGWLGDRYGPRATLIRLVLWWSAFVALTPTIGLFFPNSAELLGTAIPVAFLVLVAAEFLFGMGEAGAFPNISKAAYNWFPADHRGFAKGAVWTCARLAGGLTPAIWVLLTHDDYGGWSWRQALWMFSGLAVVWAVIFTSWFRNQPGEHPAVNAAERELIQSGRGDSRVRGAVPWRAILGSRNLWALCGMYMVANYCWYYCLYYLPGDLKARYEEANPGGGDELMVAIVGGGPLLVGMIGCYLGGVLSDAYIRRTGSRKWGRRLFGMLGYSLAGASYMAAASLIHVHANFWAIAGCLILVGLFNDLMMGPAWATTQDVGGKYSAIVGGMMNMLGNLGAVLGIQATGRILKAHTVGGSVTDDGYVLCFGMYAVVYAMGAGLWLLIDPTKPIDPDQPDPSGDTYSGGGSESA